MHPLLEQQTALHTEATDLLNNLLLPLLSNYGEVEIGGSYIYKLMYQPDIDIGLTFEGLSRERYIDLCSELLSLEGISGFKTADRVAYPHEKNMGHPTGYWLSPSIHFGNNVWTCDIWFQKPEWDTGSHARFADALRGISDEQKIQILSLKESLVQAGRYGVGKDFESVDVYDAVLKSPPQSWEELQQHFGLII